MPWILSGFADEAGETTDGQIAACVAGGLTHIDPRNVDGYNITELPLNLADQVARQYQAVGIKVNMYGSPIGKIDITDDLQIDLDKLDHLGRLRDIFGATDVRIFSFYNKTGVDKATWQRESLDRLKRLRDRAGDLGLVLFHENESDIFGDHPDDVAKIAELRDGKTFKLIYDFANYIRTGATPQTCWEMFKNQTDCFHLKDQMQDGQHVPIGNGDTDAEAILRDAIESGWQGSFVLEPHLTHSKAVVATGAHGTGDVSLASMSSSESFQVAAQSAHNLLKSVGVNLNTEID
jgi:sugar phosphate isomerase/epimerase